MPIPTTGRWPFLSVSWGRVSCVPSSLPRTAVPGGRVGDSHSLWQVAHCSPPPPALGGPEHRSRRFPPAATLCGGFGICTSGGARARPPTAGVRPGGASDALPARRGAVLVGDTRFLCPRELLSQPGKGSWLVRRCFQAPLSSVGWPLPVFPRAPFLACDLACSTAWRVLSRSKLSRNAAFRSLPWSRARPRPMMPAPRQSPGPVPGRPRASPGGEGLRPPMRRSASARRRPCRLARLRPRRLRPGFARWGGAAASPESPGRAGDAFRSVPVPARWPATNPRARTGFSARPRPLRGQPFAQRTAQSEYPRFFRACCISTPLSAFWILCQTDLAGPRRCADPGRSVEADPIGSDRDKSEIGFGRSVEADPPGNPPIRRVDLPRAARGCPPCRGGTGRAAVGRAGSFNSGKSARLLSLGETLANIGILDDSARVCLLLEHLQFGV